jgi:hypothetical protein
MDWSNLNEKYFENFSRSLMREAGDAHISVFGKVYFGALARMKETDPLTKHVDEMKSLHACGVHGVFPCCLWTGEYVLEAGEYTWKGVDSLDAVSCPWRLGEIFPSLLRIEELGQWAGTYVDRDVAHTRPPENSDDIASEWDRETALANESSETGDPGAASKAPAVRWTKELQLKFVRAAFEHFEQQLPDDGELHEACGRQQERCDTLEKSVRRAWLSLLTHFLQRLVPCEAMPDFSLLLLLLEEAGVEVAEVEKFVREWQPT